MQRVRRSTAVAVLPADPIGGTPGYFPMPDPGGGVPAAVPGYEWYNNVQEELLAVIEGAGLTASGSDRTQLLQAITKMITPGQIAFFPASSPPAGWVKANGALLTRASYAALWTFAQASGNIVVDGSWAAGMFSTGDLTTTFRIPDLRGEFVRGWDNARGVDAARAIGTAQAQDIQPHVHSNGYSSQTQAGSGGTYWAGQVSSNTGSAGVTETRPRNVALLPCIKY